MKLSNVEAFRNIEENFVLHSRLWEPKGYIFTRVGYENQKVTYLQR
jgi:hypothetical protein